MGTTQRIGTGVKNEPNWGNLTTSITSAAKAVADLQKDSEIEQGADPETSAKLVKRHATLSKRRDAHIRATYRNLLKIGGGSKKISSGRSSKIGRAGLKSSRKLVSFFSRASTNGLEPALKEIGFSSLAGKTVQDVIDYLIIFCGDSAIGMDETAANKAISEVLRKVENEANEDLGNLGDLLKEYADGEKLAELLCNFFGIYIFEYISERLEERITQMRGEAVSRETFDHIKKDIMGRVTRLNVNRPIAKIDWAGEAGKSEIERIFEAVIKIEE